MESDDTEHKSLIAQAALVLAIILSGKDCGGHRSYYIALFPKTGNEKWEVNEVPGYWWIHIPLSENILMFNKLYF